MTIDSLTSSPNFDHSRYKRSTLHQNYYLLKSNYYYADISMSHWQLKDLICASSTSNSIYYPTNNLLKNLKFDGNPNNKKTRSNDIHPDSITTTTTQFQTSQRCLKELDGIVAIGGVVNSGVTNANLGNWKGLFGLYIGETKYTENKSIGTLANNSVALYKESNSHYKSVVCNNDQDMFILDVLNRGNSLLDTETKVNLGLALNHASISPDQGTIIAVGDSSKISLLHPNENMNDLANKTVINTTYDCGFSTDWSQSGLQFSVCFQEGVNLIYDIRKQNDPIHIIESTRRNAQSGAFRVCKFSGGTDDLLFITEHQNRVHMVDIRNYNNHQIILLPKNYYDQNTDTYNQPIIKPFDEVTSIEAAEHNSSNSSTSSGGSNGNFRTNQLERRPFNSTMYARRTPSQRHQAPSSQLIGEETQHLQQRRFRLQWPEDEDSHTRQFRRSGMGQEQNSSLIQEQLQSVEAGDNNSNVFDYLHSNLEISGMDITHKSNVNSNIENSLIIGFENGGLIKWQIDSWKRRCFPSFEMT